MTPAPVTHIEVTKINEQASRRYRNQGGTGLINSGAFYTDSDGTVRWEAGADKAAAAEFLACIRAQGVTVNPTTHKLTWKAR